jgi:beta-N-acetylhexosaminidase
MKGASGQLGIPASAVRALAAGADALCIGARVDADLVNATADAIVEAVRAGTLDVARLEEAAGRTAVLAQLPPPVASSADGVDGFGLGAVAARRALRVEGTLPRLRKPLLVQLDSPATIAAGELPWGLTSYLLDGPGADLVRVSPDSGTDAADLVAAAGDRPVLVVSRDTHRHPYARRLVEQLAAAHPEVVLVEMGWPAAWRPAGLRAYLATYGASRASSRAAADALFTVE